MNPFKKIIQTFVPYTLKLEYRAWKIKQRDMKQIVSVQEAIKTIEVRYPELKCDNSVADSPIFIFSAGWRSGSTLLQRLVMSDKSVVIWGEPFNRCNLIQMHADSLSSINSLYPKDRWFFNAMKAQGYENLTDIFIANMSPEMEYLKKAHQDFFLGLLAKPAIDNNYSRWGLKEVRLGIDDAIYLKWLFPNAKFVFLYRNPYKSYTSLRPYLNSWALYENWPTTPVRSPYSFGRYWKNLVEGYLNRSHEVDALVVKYEELCHGEFPIEKLENYLDISIEKSILTNQVGQTPKKEPMTKGEFTRLKKAIGSLAIELGYIQ